MALSVWAILVCKVWRFRDHSTQGRGDGLLNVREPWYPGMPLGLQFRCGGVWGAPAFECLGVSGLKGCRVQRF